jgi:hypothetical protein
MEEKQCRDNETFVMLDEYANAVGPMRAMDTGGGRARPPHTMGLLTAEEAVRLFACDDPLNRMLVLWSGHAPVILQRTKYYECTPFSWMYDRW